MNWFKKRLEERSTKIQLLQLVTTVFSVSTGLPVEVLVGIGAAIAGVGAVVPDK